MDLSAGPAQTWTAVRDASQIGDARRQAKALCRRFQLDEVTTGSVAITLVELGLTLPGVQTALDAERGMRLLRHTLDPEARTDADDRFR